MTAEFYKRDLQTFLICEPLASRFVRMLNVKVLRQSICDSAGGGGGLVVVQRQLSRTLFLTPSSLPHAFYVRTRKPDLESTGTHQNLVTQAPVGLLKKKALGGLVSRVSFMLYARYLRTKMDKVFFCTHPETPVQYHQKSGGAGVEQAMPHSSTQTRQTQRSRIRTTLQAKRQTSTTNK